jgi:2-(1,2-epoxy-1,2-dihydrophenyl)acetyl-CoA isomerase
VNDAAEERVELVVDDGLAALTLTRPEGLNAIDPRWTAAFSDAVASCARPEVRAVLISAQGPSFTVGGDLHHFAARATDLSVALSEMIPAYHEALGQLAGLDCPVVCAVQGAAAGGGLGLTFCADLVLAASDARFVCGFALLGMSGDGCGSWFLPRLVGLRRAQEMMFGNRQLSASEALEWGLVTRVVAPDELQATALTLARELADGPTVAFAHMRRLLRESWGATLEEQLVRESDAMLVTGDTDDAREGVEAFVARRTPRFDGR